MAATSSKLQTLASALSLSWGTLSPPETALIAAKKAAPTAPTEHRPPSTRGIADDLGLPDEVWLNIFSRLPAETVLYGVRPTCQLFRRLADDGVLLRNMLRRSEEPSRLPPALMEQDVTALRKNLQSRVERARAIEGLAPPRRTGSWGARKPLLLHCDSSEAAWWVFSRRRIQCGTTGPAAAYPVDGLNSPVCMAPTPGGAPDSAPSFWGITRMRGFFTFDPKAGDAAYEVSASTEPTMVSAAGIAADRQHWAYGAARSLHLGRWQDGRAVEDQTTTVLDAIVEVSLSYDASVVGYRTNRGALTFVFPQQDDAMATWSVTSEEASSGACCSFSMSQDGQCFAAATSVGLWVGKPHAGEVVQVGKGAYRAVALDPTGTYLAAARDENSFVIWKVGDSEPRRLLNAGTREEGADRFEPMKIRLRFSSDSQALVVQRDDGILHWAW